MNLADEGVVQRRGRLGFALKPLARAGIVLQIAREEFERDVALENLPRLLMTRYRGDDSSIASETPDAGPLPAP